MSSKKTHSLLLDDFFCLLESTSLFLFLLSSFQKRKNKKQVALLQRRSRCALENQIFQRSSLAPSSLSPHSPSRSVFIQTEPRGKSVRRFPESRVLFSSLFLKKNWFFSSLVPKFLSLASSSSPSSSCRPFLSRKDQRKKNIARRSPRVSIAQAVSSHHHARQKALALLQTLLAFGGVFFLLLSSARMYSSYVRERERERERERVETRRSRARKISSKNLLFSLSKLKVPPPKEKGRKRGILKWFSSQERKERCDGAVLTINQRQSEMSCRDTVSSSSNSLRNRSRRATKPLVLKQPSASLQSRATGGNTKLS